jgi:hypothetical protein
MWRRRESWELEVMRVYEYRQGSLDRGDIIRTFLHLPTISFNAPRPTPQNNDFMIYYPEIWVLLTE